MKKKNTEDAFFNYMVSAAVFQTQFQIYYSKENYLTSFWDFNIDISLFHWKLPTVIVQEL